MASSPARASSDQAPVALRADLPTHLTATLIDDLAVGRVGSMSSLAAALAAVPDARGRRGAQRRRTGQRGGLHLGERTLAAPPVSVLERAGDEVGQHGSVTLRGV